MSEFSVKNLHNGLGVRCPRLVDIRGSALGDRLHVEATDVWQVVQAKVLIRVELAIVAVAGGDHRLHLLLEHLFNTPFDPAINGLNQGQRLARLAMSKPLFPDGTPVPGMKKGVTSKRAAGLGREVDSHWEERPPAPLDDAEVAARRELEGRRRRGEVGPRTGLAPVFVEEGLRDWNRGGRLGIERNLRSLHLHFEVYGRCLVTVRHRDGGESLCAFTRPELLDGYWRRTGKRLGDRAVGGGARLLDVLARAGGVGLLVNPFADDGSGGYWRADQVASMVTGGSGGA